MTSSLSSLVLAHGTQVHSRDHVEGIRRALFCTFRTSHPLQFAIHLKAIKCDSDATSSYYGYEASTMPSPHTQDGGHTTNNSNQHRLKPHVGRHDLQLFHNRTARNDPGHASFTI
ncbi:hypothetical protein BD410DRAFT_388665 [Rickenella mellea]|uniref:Uncharacterized protein n=1 Tax=Rickenella mellea TaxID=50990 RepID=A0A4Y7PYC4_9AGAM|nr:hypothetical protein BD410DRAFT_388665 [Rickenella mellea]